MFYENKVGPHSWIPLLRIIYLLKFIFFLKLGDLEQHIYFFTVFEVEKFKILAPEISYLVK